MHADLATPTACEATKLSSYLLQPVPTQPYTSWPQKQPASQLPTWANLRPLSTRMRFVWTSRFVKAEAVAFLQTQPSTKSLPVLQQAFLLATACVLGASGPVRYACVHTGCKSVLRWCMSHVLKFYSGAMHLKAPARANDWGRTSWLRTAVACCLRASICRMGCAQQDIAWMDSASCWTLHAGHVENLKNIFCMIDVCLIFG
jgi:hypothetical protein